MGNRIQTGCAEPFWLIAYARKNSKRLLCGLFYGEIKANLEVKMLITLQKGQGRGNVKKIKVEGGSDKEKEIIIRHETAHRRSGFRGR